MAIHHTTFVLPGSASGQPYDLPFLVLGADEAEEVASLPAVTSLHRRGNAAMPFRHASMVLGEFPISDVWATTVETQYDRRAKVVILREPTPRDISTEYAELAEGVLGRIFRPGWGW